MEKIFEILLKYNTEFKYNGCHNDRHILIIYHSMTKALINELSLHNLITIAPWNENAMQVTFGLFH